MKYKLIAKDVNGKTIMSGECETEGEAYLGFDIWCDALLYRENKLEVPVTVNLINTKNNETILTKNL